ncbi:hypothetical protein L3Q82_003900 [Scortum barcoo]|uniref:Uncharacterized protein n=1 Tax=Scortum barcoo TaxID=214431 RepID=A0ACB8X650_9TELE|nr:hypothetical protein L3Q82_003900 [Scortum barcoo]
MMTTSHSDIFTYHLVAIEIISVFGSIICCWNLSKDHINMLLVGFCLWSLIWYDMSINSSSSNDSLPLPHLPSNISSDKYCIMTPPSSFIFTSFFTTNILLLLPLCIFILYLGLQQWRRQSSASTATTSHSDIFTYHLVAVEMISITGCILSCFGIREENVTVSLVGLSFWYFTWYGETSFHVLTCVERYLAVVHPITYLSLRGERGIRVRNISIGCVWLLSIGGACLLTLEENFIFVDLCLLVSLLVVSSFCSLSALCALIRPRPGGNRAGTGRRLTNRKRRAFYTMVAILGVLLLRFIFNLSLVILILLTENFDCLMLSFGAWVNLPSSLVLPLLYLHRAGTLACRKNCNK